MSNWQNTQDRSEPGRYVLLPEDPAATSAAADDSRRPRVRRYRLARFGGDVDGGRAERRPVGDFAYLRRPHD